jgi:predicted RNase H-like HicB family nuclease
MSRKIELTAIIEKEGNMYVSFCPELDIATQGKSRIIAKKI